MYLFNPITELVFNLHVWVTGFKKDTGPNPQLGSGVWKSTEMAQKLGEIRCVCTMGRRSQGAVMELPHFTHGCVVTQAYGTGRSCFYHGGEVSHQDLRYAHQQTFKIEVDFLFKEKKTCFFSSCACSGECNSGPRHEQETGFARIAKILRIKIKNKIIIKARIYSRQNSKSTHCL